MICFRPKITAGTLLKRLTGSPKASNPNCAILSEARGSARLESASRFDKSFLCSRFPPESVQCAGCQPASRHWKC
jgi:hypothetical protein